MSTDDVVHLQDLTDAVRTLREDNARLAEEIRTTRSRTGWILLLASLLFVFGSCAGDHHTDAASTSELSSFRQQVVGSDGDSTPGRDLRSVQLQQCQMIGALGRQLKTDPTRGLTAGHALDSGCVDAARRGFRGESSPTP